MKTFLQPHLRPLAGAMLAGACLAATGAAAAGPTFRLEKVVTIPGGDSGWDYPSLDARRNRMFIAHRDEGLHVYDIRSGKVIRTLAQSAGANTSALAPEFDLGIVGTRDGHVVVFRLSTLATLARYKSETDGFDGAAYDPVSKRIAIVGEADEDTKQTPVLLFDARTGKPVGKVVVDSIKVDAPRADNQGNIWMPLRDRAALARVDVRTMRLAATVPLDPACRKPAALELDRPDRRIYVGCRGDEQTAPRLLVVDADDARTIAAVPIGRGVDEVMYDARRGQIMTANGEDGSLSVIAKQSADRYQAVETIGTRPLARTGVLDERTGKIYLVNAQYYKRAGDGGDEDSLHFVPGTFSVLTYTR